MPLSAAEIQDYYGRFFVLQEGFLRGALRVAPVGKTREPHALTRGERTVRKPVRFKPDEGSRPLDLVGATWAVLTIVSRRVIAVLESERFAPAGRHIRLRSTESVSTPMPTTVSQCKAAAGTSTTR